MKQIVNLPVVLHVALRQTGDAVGYGSGSSGSVAADFSIFHVRQGATQLGGFVSEMEQLNKGGQ